MTRDEMVRAVSKLMTGDASDAELDSLPLELDRAAPGSRITDLIYYPEVERTPEQIVDEALARVGTWNDD
jgi:hypothetical protein